MRAALYDRRRWNVPDWWEAEQYPGRNCSLRQWAWEFLRRNHDYRELWSKHIEPFCKPDGTHDRVGLCGPTRGVPVERQAQLVHRFGLESFPPPPADDRHPPRFAGTGLRYYDQDLSGERLNLIPGQIAVVFDLSHPTDDQLKAAEALIARERRRLRKAKALKSHRLRIDCLRDYLRVLDAEDAKVRATDIAAALFSQLPKDQGLYRVRDYRNASRKLRDFGYLAILHGPKGSTEK